MKLINLLFYIFLSATASIAQTERIKIAIFPATSTQADKENKDAAQQIENLIVENFTDVKRAEVVVSPAMLHSLNADSVSALLKKQKAKYKVMTNLNFIEIKQAHTEPGNPESLRAYLTFTIIVMDVETETALYTELIATAYTVPEKVYWKNNRPDAIAWGVKKCKDDMKDFIHKKICPLEGLVISIEDEKEKLLRIGLGIEDGVEKKQVFVVKEKVEEAGQAPFYREIGKIRIEEVNSANRSIAKITGGADKILQKMNAKAKLVVVI